MFAHFFVSTDGATPERGGFLRFVKIILTKNGNFGLAMRKRLFCDAKEPLLPCKTYAFAMPNNRFCKVLVHRLLCDNYGCEKCLQPCGVFCLYIIRYRGERVGAVWRIGEGAKPLCQYSPAYYPQNT
ncbi:hypothetical protein CTM55_09605 [Prevotella intermedia]|nr:hypothetical protein CTM55_09605 [Prevotella intermedia]